MKRCASFKPAQPLASLINENLTDRIFRFIPEERRFVACPIVPYGTHTHDFSFSKDGKACTSNNPVPPAAPGRRHTRIDLHRSMRKKPPQPGFVRSPITSTAVS